MPNLRFPEFSGEWDEYRLDEVMKFSDDRVSSSVLTVSDYVSTENMLQDFQGIVNAKSVPIDTNVISFEIGDVLMSNIRPYLKKVWSADRNGGCSADVFVMRAIQELCSKDFLHYLIANEQFISYVMSGAKGLKMPRGDKNQIRKYRILLPSIEEQLSISNLFTLLDKRIEAQIRVIEQYESLIKRAIDKALFNKTWASYKVSDFMEFYSTNSLSWEDLDYEHGTTLANLHYGLIHAGLSKGLDLSTMALPYIKYDKTPKQYTLCKGGDVAFADASEDTNDVAKSVEFVNCNHQQVVCGLHTIHGRDTKGLTITGFKGYLFAACYFRNQIKRLCQGSKIYSVTPKNIGDCNVLIPSKAEQQKIVSCLSAMEAKLSTERNLLEFYRTQKSYLLSQMFI